jgi:predicted transcriptional regulator
MDAEATAPARESDLIALAADIVSAFVSNNSVATGDLPNLINDVHSALKRVGALAARSATNLSQRSRSRSPSHRTTSSLFSTDGSTNP